jgi:PAS domain S-box-containing protein
VALTQERLLQLIERSPDIIVATDRKGTVIYYNDGAEKSLGYTDAEILGHYAADLYPGIDEARRVMQAMKDGGGGVETFQTRFLSKSGEVIPVAITGTLLRDETGAPDGTIGFAKDLREILRKDQLATLGAVAIGVSHEINNPLAVILNQTELLERDIERLAGDAECPVELERLDAVRRELARIAEIVERLGQMAREETYETVSYIGPARMLDLRARRQETRARDRRLAGLRVLVADDDLGIARSLKELLEGDGCEVVTASDGLEALEKLSAAHFDAVVTDVVMPNMDGHELFLQIQQRWPGLPVLMMTAFHYDKDHIIKRSKVAGLATVLFKKPVDPVKLREKLLEAVEAAKRR